MLNGYRMDIFVTGLQGDSNIHCNLHKLFSGDIKNPMVKFSFRNDQTPIKILNSSPQALKAGFIKMFPDTNPGSHLLII